MGSHSEVHTDVRVVKQKRIGRPNAVQPKPSAQIIAAQADTFARIVQITFPPAEKRVLASVVIGAFREPTRHMLPAVFRFNILDANVSRSYPPPQGVLAEPLLEACQRANRGHGGKGRRLNQPAASPVGATDARGASSED